MPKKANARRYAQAVFELALEANKLEQWQADLQIISDAIGDEAVLTFLASPKISVEKKTNLLSGNLRDINPLALNLVMLLISRSGIGMIGEIAGEYQRLLDAYHGIQEAEVTTAVPLDDADKERLAERLGSLLGSKITIKSEVDPEILGGIVARINGKLLDGSTRSKLAALKRELVGTSSKG
jgi:F-type H+-transporting ATPase subunit delta